MKSKVARFVLILALTTGPLAVHATPPVDVPCQVLLRHDSNDLLIRTLYAGKLNSVDKDWICLKTDKEEIWIPISGIQTIQFTSGSPKPNKDITGVYLNEQKPSDRIELKADGSFSGQDGPIAVSGTYSCVDGNLTFTTPDGRVTPGAKIAADGLTDRHGDRWVKQPHSTVAP